MASEQVIVRRTTLGRRVRVGRRVPAGHRGVARALAARERTEQVVGAARRQNGLETDR